MSGGEGRFISALCRPLTPSLSVNISRQPCQGIYVKVTMAELAVRLFQSAPYQSCVGINETDNAHILNKMHIVTIAKHTVVHLDTCLSNTVY